VGRIFISYRRDDAAGHAGWLHRLLVDHFGPDQVFRDVDNLPPGVNFVEEIRRQLASCCAVVALIGPEWLTVTDRKGNRRLDDPHDYVRLEIASALQRGIRIFPALLRNTPMPSADDLPDELKDLAFWNAIELDEHAFEHDTATLAAALKVALDESERGQSNTETPAGQAELPVTRGSAEDLSVEQEVEGTAGIGSIDADAEQNRRVARIVKMRPGARRDHAVDALRQYEAEHDLVSHRFHFESYTTRVRAIERMHKGQRREAAIAELRAYEAERGLRPHHFRFER